MTIDDLSLPVDIPWERRCVSEDMLDERICDREFPNRWRSSVAVFSYEPPEEYQEYDGMTVSYLKIAATITGYQPDPSEVGIDDPRLDSNWQDSEAIENYREVVGKYYPCYGAILEVAVGPPDENAWEADRYPYVVDYEPKKREVYETRTESGERMSRTLERVNVKKGVTTTESTQVLDVYKGGSQSTSAGAQGASVSQSSSHRGEWGTRTLDKEQRRNVQQSDRAREERETNSHTTKLTQMYHKLDSYHLGTNRTNFFMFPRPHIKENKKTFVNGPRKLEGVQEFMLVVLRPEEMENFDVEAYLETGHIGNKPVTERQQRTDSAELTLSRETENVSDRAFVDDTQTWTKSDSVTYTPPPGWQIDTDRNGGYRVTGKEINSAVGSDYAKVTDVAPDHLTMEGEVSAKYEDKAFNNPTTSGDLRMGVEIYLESTESEVVGHENTLYLTGRGVCCRATEEERSDRDESEEEEMEDPVTGVTGRDSYGTSVTYETELDHQVGEAVGDTAQIDVDTSNAVVEEIGRKVRGSINSVDRYPAGQVGFAETRLVTSTVAQLLDEGHPDDRTVGDLAGEDATDADDDRSAYRRRAILDASVNDLARQFDLDVAGACRLKRTALGIGTDPAASAQR
jgi:hypothetical protein